MDAIDKCKVSDSLGRELVLIESLERLFFRIEYPLYIKQGSVTNGLNYDTMPFGCSRCLLKFILC